MGDKLRDWALFLRDFLQDKMGWFLFGLGLGGASWYFANHRAEMAENKAILYEERYFECQKHSTEIEIQAQRECIGNAQDQIKAMMQVSEMLKGQSKNIEQRMDERREIRMNENKELLKEIERVKKIKNENR